MTNVSAINFCVALLVCGHVTDPQPIQPTPPTNDSGEWPEDFQLSEEIEDATRRSIITDPRFEIPKLSDPTSVETLDSVIREISEATDIMKSAESDVKKASDMIKASTEFILLFDLLRSRPRTAEMYEPLEPHMSKEKKKKKYVLVKMIKANWYNAKRYCEGIGMELATIENKEDQKELESVIDDVGFDIGSVLTGGSDTETKGQFYWSSPGIPMSYTNWQSGQPSGGQEHCLVVWQTGRGYFWNDVSCEKEYNFACEYFEGEMYLTFNVSSLFHGK